MLRLTAADRPRAVLTLRGTVARNPRVSRFTTHSPSPPTPRHRIGGTSDRGRTKQAHRRPAAQRSSPSAERHHRRTPTDARPQSTTDAGAGARTCNQPSLALERSVLPTSSVKHQPPEAKSVRSLRSWDRTSKQGPEREVFRPPPSAWAKAIAGGCLAWSSRFGPLLGSSGRHVRPAFLRLRSHAHERRSRSLGRTPTCL